MLKHSAYLAAKNIYHRAYLPSFGLFLTDKKTLLGTDWLNDNIINACQQLLQKQFSLQGLQSPQCGRNLTFKVVPLSKIYIQILHVNSNIGLLLLTLIRVLTWFLMTEF